MSDNTALRALTEQMAREGIRRLLIISGEENWCQGQALALRDILPGDWLWVGVRHRRCKRYWGASFVMQFSTPGRDLTLRRLPP